MLTPKRHFSYSQYITFKGSPKWYFLKYFCDKKYEGGYEFGKKVSNSLEKEEGVEDTDIELKMLNTFIKKYPKMNYEIECVFTGIPLYARFDGFDEKNLELGEYKTGDLKYKWTQTKADKHIQITWYYLMVYMKFKKLITKATLHYIPVKRKKSVNGTILKEEIIFEELKDFETKRTLSDIAKLGVDITRVWKQIDRMGEDLLVKGYTIIKGKKYYKK